MERFTIYKNNEGIFRVEIKDTLGPRWLTDIDTMMAVIGSHRSKILNFYSHDEADRAIRKVLDKEKLAQELWNKKPVVEQPEPSDTFKPV